MTPLAKRLPRELRRNIGKYLGIFLLMCGSIALTSGFLLAAHSIGCLIDGMRDAYIDRRRPRDHLLRGYRQSTQSSRGRS